MSSFEDVPDYEEIPQNFFPVLADKKICLALAYAACVLMAADPALSPEDAALDACQTYHCLLTLHARQEIPDN